MDQEGDFDIINTHFLVNGCYKIDTKDHIIEIKPTAESDYSRFSYSKKIEFFPQFFVSRDFKNATSLEMTGAVMANGFFGPIIQKVPKTEEIRHYFLIVEIKIDGNDALDIRLLDDTKVNLNDKNALQVENGIVEYAKATYLHCQAQNQFLKVEESFMSIFYLGYTAEDFVNEAFSRIDS